MKIIYIIEIGDYYESSCIQCAFTTKKAAEEHKLHLEAQIGNPECDYDLVRMYEVMCYED